MKSVTFWSFTCLLAAVSGKSTIPGQDDRKIIKSIPDKLELGNFFISNRDKSRAPDVQFVGVILKGLHNLFNSNLTLVESKNNKPTIRFAVSFYNLTFSATVRCFYKHEPYVMRYLSTADEMFSVSCISSDSAFRVPYNGHSSVRFLNVTVEGQLDADMDYERGTTKLNPQIDWMSSTGWSTSDFPTYAVDHNLVDSIADFFAVPSESFKNEMIKRVEAKIFSHIDSRLNS